MEPELEALLVKGLRDTQLKWRTRGILSFLVCFYGRGGWTAKMLTAVRPDGSDATQRGVRELVEAGYAEQRLVSKNPPVRRYFLV